jgi:hypothetical protein
VYQLTPEFTPQFMPKRAKPRPPRTVPMQLSLFAEAASLARTRPVAGDNYDERPALPRLRCSPGLTGCLI